MTDLEFLTSFEDGSIAAEHFDHRAHIRAACLYLMRYPFLEACIAMRDSLKRFAERIGKAGIYHETMTVAFMSILLERISQAPGLHWQALIDANPDLMESSLLSRFYHAETLRSQTARRQFVLADSPSNPPLQLDGNRTGANHADC
jgi:hypothetical protein